MSKERGSEKRDRRMGQEKKRRDKTAGRTEEIRKAKRERKGKRGWKEENENRSQETRAERS